MKISYPLVLFFIISMSPLAAQVRLPRLIRDSMILQRELPINVWGWAAQGEKVTVHFNGKSYHSKAGSDGKWQLQMAATKAGGPFTMNIDATNHLTIKEILVGDVWVCSGQSNMVHQMSLHAVRYAAEVANTNYPQIRHFWVPNTINLQSPQQDLPGGFWKSANPKDIGEFSAVAYFFAKNIYEKYHVPIGLINASWGGTPIEAWMSQDAFVDFPGILSTIQQNKDSSYINSFSRKNFTNDNEKTAIKNTDKGLTENWFAENYTAKGWRNINIPGYWEDQGIKNLDGTVWYRREIQLTERAAGAAAKVFLGRIVDADVLYINGRQVGSTSYLYPQRRYSIPHGILRAGKNLFVIRVTNNAGKGGFVPDKPYELIAGTDTIDLKGDWQYKVGQVQLPQTRSAGGMFAGQNQPTGLYNSMIAPMLNYGIKGFLWYQGESNTGKASDYTALQAAMVKDWRQKWHAADAPFLYVQLPGFMDMNYLPSESQWAMFRDAQLKALSVPASAMAVAIDLGEWNDIHPDRKKEVGDRLALAAENLAYGDQSVEYAGPLLQSAKVEGKQIILSFSHATKGLTSSDGEPLSEFAIAGSDKKFVWANATIEGNTIIVWSEDISHPLYVRYAWADNPVNPNLCNKEGLPASPFRTDE